MSFFGTTDFNLEVLKGNVPGHSYQQVIGRIMSTVGSGVFEDVWTPGGVRSNIAGAETYDISSTSTNDTSGGTGAQACLVLSLDANHDPQTTFVTMNGTTAVTLSGTHIRPRQALITPGFVGSLETNEGEIEVRKSGSSVGVDIRSCIPPGFSVSQDGQFTVPNGKTAFIKQFSTFLPKNEDGIIRNTLQQFGPNQPLFLGVDLPLYQSGIIVPSLATTALPSEIDINFQVATTNAGVELTITYDMILIDNDLINT